MSKKRKDLLKDKKIISRIGIILVVLVLVFIFLFNRDKKEIEEEKNIMKLTEEYNKNHNKTEGILGEKDIVNQNEIEDIKESAKQEDIEDIQGTYKIADIQTLDESATDREIEDFTVFFSEKINDKSYDELYSILNEGYKKDFEYSKEKFEFEYSFNGDIRVEVTNVETPVEKDRLFITTKLIEKANGAFRVIDFTIFKDGTIADMIVKSAVDLPYEKEIDNVIYKINKRYDTRLGAIYNVEIENNSDKLIKIDDMLIENSGVIYSYEIISENTILESYPGTPFKFMMKLPNNNDIDHVVLKCTDFNGNHYEITILDKEV